MAKWKKNTGVVPEEVTAETQLWVKYRDGNTHKWEANDKILKNNNPVLWSLEGEANDVVEYSMERPEEEYGNQSR